MIQFKTISDLVKFKNLGIGDTFRVNGNTSHLPEKQEPRLKTPNSEITGSGVPFNCVRLETGVCDLVSDDELVEKITIEATIVNRLSH